MAFIQETEIVYNNVSGTTWSSASMTLTAGHLAVLILAIANTATTPTVTDTQGNTYTNLVSGTAVTASNSSMFNPLGLTANMFYVPNCVGGTGTATVHFASTVSGVYINIYWLEYSLVATTSPAIGYMTGIAFQSGAGTISRNTTGTGSGTSNVLVGFYETDGNNATGSSYTNRLGASNYVRGGEQASSAPGGEAVTLTVSGSGNYAGVAIVFKLAGGAVTSQQPSVNILG